MVSDDHNAVRLLAGSFIIPVSCSMVMMYGETTVLEKISASFAYNSFIFEQALTIYH